MPENHPGHTVPLNGIEMYYEVEGSGPPLLLLHGGGGCQEHWAIITISASAQERVDRGNSTDGMPIAVEP